ncbi:MAG: hypothetical protein SGI72_03090 [Planctomycetota bacterium]|nr:hypothetical protein [Planctomycetota bacterium]
MAPKLKSMRRSGTPATPPKPTHVRDIKAIQKDAENAAERRAVLAWALANDWKTADVDTIERIDEGGWHGFVMWPRP